MAEIENDFDAAKGITEILRGMDKERQLRVLRWVSETLDLPRVSIAEATPVPVLGSGNPSTPPTPTAMRSLDIKTFVDSKKPKSDNQFAAVVAYYYRFEAADTSRKDSITADDLQDAARLASRPRLASPLKTLNNAKNQGYLDSAERGAFQINSVGENLVAMTLPGASDAATAGSRRK